MTCLCSCRGNARRQALRHPELDRQVSPATVSCTERAHLACTCSPAVDQTEDLGRPVGFNGWLASYAYVRAYQTSVSSIACMHGDKAIDQTIMVRPCHVRIRTHARKEGRHVRLPSKFPGCGARAHVRARLAHRREAHTKRPRRARTELARARATCAAAASGRRADSCRRTTSRPAARATRRHRSPAAVSGRVQKRASSCMIRTHAAHHATRRHAHRTGRWMVHAFAWMEHCLALPGDAWPRYIEPGPVNRPGPKAVVVVQRHGIHP
jgi:hypothetical protein